MSITTPNSDSKPNLAVILNKERRFWAYATGNRNPYTAANVYWRQLGGWFDDADELCWRLGQDKSRHEARHIARRTTALTTLIKDTSKIRATIAYQSNVVTARRHHNGAVVLAAMASYAHENGYCSASQKSIAQATGISRQKVNQRWLPLLEEAGLIEVEGYDSRGTYWYQGREYTKWCKVYSVRVTLFLAPLYWDSGKGDTIPSTRVISLPRLPKGSKIRLSDWRDVERYCGPLAEFEPSIRSGYLVGRRQDGKLLFRPPIAGCAWALLRDCPDVWIRFR